MSNVRGNMTQLHQGEMRTMTLGVTAYVVVVLLADLVASGQPLHEPTLALSLLLAGVLAGRYSFWTHTWQTNYYDETLTRLDWLMLLVGLTACVVLARLHGDRAIPFFYLSAIEGYTAFTLDQRHWRAGLWVLGIAVLSLVSAASVVGWANLWSLLLTSLPGYMLIWVMIKLLAQQISYRTQVEQLLLNLEQAHQQLQHYADRVEALTITEERARLSYEIHDGLGHTLTALDVQLELLARLPVTQTEAREQSADHARHLAKQALTEVRQAVKALRPVNAQAFSLPEAVAALIANFEQATRLVVSWHVIGAHPLAPTLALLLYRATQEGLTNVQRHAPTSVHVTVQLTYGPQTVSLQIENGLLPEPSSIPLTPGGYGLLGLRERVVAIGGSLEAGPTPDGNFRLLITLPLL